MLVVFYNSGRLGNKLFLFSHFIVYSIKTKKKVLGLFFDEYSKYFAGTRNNQIGLFPQNKLIITNSFLRKVVNYLLFKIHKLVLKNKFLNNSLFAEYHPEHKGEKDTVYYSVDTLITNLSENKSIITFYNGGFFWYDNTDLSEYKTVLKEYFRPIKSISKNVDIYLKKAKLNYDLLVGIHIRRGDYKTFFDGRFFFSDDTYFRMIEEMRGLFKNQKVRFILVSDEKIDSEFFQNDESIISGPGKFIEDLYTLAGCNYIIGTPSTFSMWASFYGDVPLFHCRNKDDKIAISNFNIIKDRTNEFMFC